MLFSKNHLVRGEALSRLTWILTSEENSDEKLPALKTLREPLLSTICIFDNPINLKNLEEPKQFYQVNKTIKIFKNKKRNVCLRFYDNTINRKRKIVDLIFKISLNQCTLKIIIF